jgi:integrase
MTTWSRKKKDRAPRGVFCYPDKTWGIRYVCGRGCRHEEKVGLKSAAVEVHGERRALIRRERAWCPVADRDIVVVDPLTFKHHAEAWHAQTVTPHLKPRTVAYYRQVLDHHLVPAFGARPIADITTADVRAVITEKRHALGRHTVKNIVATLRACLGQAVADGALPRNPAERLGKHMRGSDRRAGVKALEPAGVAAMVEAATKIRPAHALGVETLFLTGVRIGELLGIQGPDLDARRNTLRIARAVSFRKGALLVDTPKNHQGRTIDVPPGLMAKLCEARTAHGDGWLFPAAHDPTRPMNDGWFRNRVWAPIVTAAKVPRITVHGARHTYASILLRRNTPMAYVSRQLGHSSIAVTVDLYGHFQPHVDHHHVAGLADAIEDARREREAGGPAVVPIRRRATTT